MPQNTTCPGCGQPVVVDSTAAGQPTSCPQCATVFIIPGGGGTGFGTGPAPRKKGMAIASLVLGILSVCCLSVFGGIPAIILGHIAHGRAKKSPAEHAGGGLAIAGFVMGYVSLLVLAGYLVLVFSFMRSPAFTAAMKQAQEQAQQSARQGQNHQTPERATPDQAAAEIQSVNNLKQIGLAFRVWAGDHQGQYPFNVSQQQGGTRELCQRDSNGYERNPVPTFMVMSNELSSTTILVCPNDPTKQAASDFASLTADDLSYQLRSGPNVTDSHPEEILAVDSINGIVLRCDGSVQLDPKYKKSGH